MWRAVKLRFGTESEPKQETADISGQFTTDKSPQTSADWLVDSKRGQK